MHARFGLPHVRTWRCVRPFLYFLDTSRKHEQQERINTMYYYVHYVLVTCTALLYLRYKFLAVLQQQYTAQRRKGAS